jgi:predicted GH43/DUF377 family glycosyl hydrolase
MFERMFLPIRFVVVICVCAFPVTIYSQVAWVKYASNPIFDVGGPETWDCCSAGIVSVVYDSGTYRAWYAGTDNSTGRIGYATSPDGVNWTKHGNPVLDLGNQGAWDDSQADHACVLLVEGIYRMWYSADDGSTSRIGYATSSDGLHWDKYADNPVLDLGNPGSWEDSEVFHPSVVYDGHTYHMWYNGFASSMQRTGYATSSDGIIWEKYSGNPVLEMGQSGSWDDFMLVLMATLYMDNQYHMWYTAGDGTDEDTRYFRVGYATSPDGIAWMKHPDNPVLDIGPVGTWDSVGVVTSSVLFDSSSGTYKMWYGGLDGAHFRTGYATSTPATRIHGNGTAGIPDRFELMQNFPNPFNPSTRIGFSIPRSGYVRLKIFDVLGGEIATLIDRELTPGLHTAEWDARLHASGLYISQLQYAGQILRMKMVYLK